ncbi:hypothetical protein V1514DRAFT_335093 [Lipomyces japonicus]|uniref:uncharacterized protein n=1 Tax=Lipomyces japonicus TaxID=56871 RepID=UPI0034CDD631
MDQPSFSSSRNPGGILVDDDESQLHSSFKAAALAVTTLYRSANHDIKRSHEKGYLQAIDDILAVISSGQDVYEWAIKQKYGAGERHNQANIQKQDIAMRTDSSESQHAQQHRNTQGPMDFQMTGSEFTFRSDLQLDRSYQLPNATALAKNARDIMMFTPDDVLFHAVSAQLEEEQRIQQEVSLIQQQQFQQQHGQQNDQGPIASNKRRQGGSDPTDSPETKLGPIKRYRL